MIIRGWSTNSSNWFFIRLVNRVQSTNLHDCLFVWLIIQQGFDNDCLINQLAWLIIWQWLSHIDYSGLINQLIKLIIHLSSQSSSINQSARLIFRVIDYSTMIHQCIVDYSRDILFDNDWLSHWIFIRVVNRVQSTNLHDWLFRWLVIQQWFDNDFFLNQLAWWIIRQWLSPIDYSWLIHELIKTDYSSE